jgi:hypothetical protein
VGVEPTSAALQAAACPSGPSVIADWECPRQELNLVYDLRKVVCGSGTLRGRKGTHVIRVGRKRAEAQGFEPCRAALDTACSPRSTPLSTGRAGDQGVRGDLNPPPSPSQGGVLPITPRTPSRSRSTKWSRVDSNHRSPPRQRGVFAAKRRDRRKLRARSAVTRSFDSMIQMIRDGRVAEDQIRRNTPTRTRTRNSSFEARDDFRFTIGVLNAEGEGFEPPCPKGRTR